MNNDRAKAIRSALLTAYNVGKAGGGKIIPIDDDSKREDAFNNLASQQRGDPELAMMSAQRVLRGGVMSHALEHVGDLTHRMSEKGGRLGSGYVRPKVESVLRSLKSGYGFSKEHTENMAESKVSPELENAVLNRYANEHSKLPVYNKNQELGRNAAIALGKKDFDIATQNLEELNNRIQSGIFDRENLNYDPNYEKLTQPDITKAGGGDVDLPMDEASRMARADKDYPMDLYHATSGPVVGGALKEGKTYDSFGIHFGTPETANNRFLVKANELSRDANRPITMNSPNIIPSRVKINNPLRLSENRTGRWGPSDVLMETISAAERGDVPKVTAKEIDDFYNDNLKHKGKKFANLESPEFNEVLTNWLESKGYDGIVYKNTVEGGGDSYIAFRGNQIRSRFAKFDPKRAHESDIGAATGGFIHDPEKAKRHALMIANGLHKAAGGDVEPDNSNPRAVIGGNNPPTPVYYSALKQGVANAKQMQAPPQDWKAITSKLPGVRKEEIDYSGLHNFLDKQQGQVSKADLLDHLEQNPAVKLNEVWKSGTTGPNRTWTKFGQYTLPGGTNYKELVLTLPKRPEGERNYESPAAHSYGDDASNINRLAHIRMNDRVGPNGEKLLHIEELQSDWHQTGLEEGYSDPEKQKQIDYHNGERRRMTAALQTVLDQHQDAYDAAIKPHQDAFYAAKDRHQDVYSAAIKPHLDAYDAAIGQHRDVYSAAIKQHRGAFDAAIKSHRDAYDAAKKPHEAAYDAAKKPHEDAYLAAIAPHEDAIKALGPNRGVPDAPYKDTKDWTALALKRVMRHAANNNYDGVTWTTGDQQADRYDLSKRVSSIKADQYNIADENGWRLNVKGKNGDSIPMPRHYLSDDELADHVGKDMAKKIIDSNGGEFHGLDLKVGGEGMRKYYDEIVPSVAKELAKTHGVKVGKIKMKPANKPNYAQWAYDYQQENGSQNQGHLDDAYDDFVDSKESKDLGELHYLPVTPSMKKSARLFKSGGMVEPYKHTGVIHPARMISGVHIRHETHGTPIFTGGKHGR